MHFLLIDPKHWFDFQSFGHSVTIVRPDAYETPLDRILETLPAPPDCIIQQENLGPRHFVTGLGHAPCPTFFLAFDTHLNLYWHQYYGRLFDAVLTPHLSLFLALPPESRLPNVFFMPPAATVLPWTPHADRAHSLAFCGRLTAHRPLRSHMVRTLQAAFGLEHHQDITSAEMFRLYRDARIIPNEAICFELNCRLFEGASAGAAVLTPDCGPDQATVLDDGVEMLVYHNGQDLCEKAAWMIANPGAAEVMGRKAWERMHHEHLPTHRAAAVLEILPSLSQARATGDDAAALTWLTRLERARAGDREHPARSLLAQSESLPQTPEVLAGMAHLLGAHSRRDAGLAFCHALIETETVGTSLALNATASACSLAHKDTDLALRFFARHFPGSPAPERITDICHAWAKAYTSAGFAVRPGFSFTPDAGVLPACAFEFLRFAGHLEPERTKTLRAEEARLLAPFPAYAPYRLSLLTTLRGPDSSPDEIRELAALYTFCCRADEGTALLERNRTPPSCGLPGPRV